MIDRVIAAVGKHVIAQEALTGGDEGIGVEESAPGGVVITALEIIEPGFLDYVVAIALFSGYLETPGGELAPGSGPPKRPTRL